MIRILVIAGAASVLGGAFGFLMWERRGEKSERLKRVAANSVLLGGRCCRNINVLRMLRQKKIKQKMTRSVLCCHVFCAEHELVYIMIFVLSFILYEHHSFFSFSLIFYTRSQ